MIMAPSPARVGGPLGGGRLLPLLSLGTNSWCLGSCSGPLCCNKALPAKQYCVFRFKVTAFAYKNYKKKVKKDGSVPQRTLENETIPPSELNVAGNSPSRDGDNSIVRLGSFVNDSNGNDPSRSPSRKAVLQACIATSGLIFAVGAVLRQVSYIVFTEGWLKFDATSEVSFHFEPWHIELIIGLVTFISTSRFLLLKIWPDFAESSEAANQQVLSSLEPFDYLVVSFLPGISEELLFRGALLPFFGLNWTTALIIGTIFGGLHLGNGRRYPFAIWATFVGFCYGLATIASSSILVPMAAHSLNNLAGGVLWYYKAKSQDNHTTN